MDALWKKYDKQRGGVVDTGRIEKGLGKMSFDPPMSSDAVAALTDRFRAPSGAGVDYVRLVSWLCSMPAKKLDKTAKQLSKTLRGPVEARLGAPLTSLVGDIATDTSCAQQLLEAVAGGPVSGGVLDVTTLANNLQNSGMESQHPVGDREAEARALILRFRSGNGPAVPVTLDAPGLVRLVLNKPSLQVEATGDGGGGGPGGVGPSFERQPVGDFSAPPSSGLGALGGPAGGPGRIQRPGSASRSRGERGGDRPERPSSKPRGAGDAFDAMARASEDDVDADELLARAGRLGTNDFPEDEASPAPAEIPSSSEKKKKKKSKRRKSKSGGGPSDLSGLGGAPGLGGNRRGGGMDLGGMLLD